MNYKEIFHAAEKSIIEYGSQNLETTKIKYALSSFKNYQDRELTDDQYFWILTYVVFYSGFRAAIVSAKKERINRWLPDWRTVAGYSENEVQDILADKGMIRNRRKITACINNAKTIGQIVEKYGSFKEYISSFSPGESFENLLLLKEELEGKFDYLGGITVYHFLTDIGMPVLKPDRVICRIFHRLGLIETEGQLLKTVTQLSQATKILKVLK